MSIVLALIICTPRVTVQALADDGSAPATSTPVSSLAALAPAATGAVGHDQADVVGAPATSTPGSSSASLAPAATGSWSWVWKCWS